MKTTLLFFPALFASLTLSQNQNQLPSTLPACAQQCTVLTNAQQSCTSNPTAYQSCFCQSSLLSQLYSSQPIQLCTQCSASDMAAIQSWYKGTCGQGGAGAAAANNGPSTTPAATPPPPTNQANTPTTTTPPVTGATVTNQQDSNSAQNTPKGPWMSTHYQWVIMLIILVLGLPALAFAFWFFHRRYHRRREAQWNQATGSTPNISTWGPGQSVHDLGFTPGASGAGGEKGKGREQTRAVNEPPPARMKENRLSKA